MDISDVSRAVPGGLEVEILVSPRSGRSGPDGFDEWRRRMTVRVKAPPLDGRANREAEEIFRNITGCACEIRYGHLNRQKTIMIYGEPSEICEKLRSGI